MLKWTAKSAVSSHKIRVMPMIYVCAVRSETPGPFSALHCSRAFFVLKSMSSNNPVQKGRGEGERCPGGCGKENEPVHKASPLHQGAQQAKQKTLVPSCFLAKSLAAQDFCVRVICMHACNRGSILYPILTAFHDGTTASPLTCYAPCQEASALRMYDLVLICRNTQVSLFYRTGLCFQG